MDGMLGRRRVIAISSLAAVCLVVVGTLTARAVADEAASSPDPAAFQQYVATYVNGWSDSNDPGGPARDEAWVGTHSGQVLAAGNRACSWLAAKPDAPTVDPSGNRSVDSLARAYIGIDVARWAGPLSYDEPGSDVGVTLSPMGRLTLVAGAWEYLCRSTREAKTARVSLNDE